MKVFIYQNIEDLKIHVGGSANLSIRQESIEPIMRNTLFSHIIPWLGETFWTEWSDQYLHEATTIQGKLQPHLQRALGFLSLYEYSKIASVMFGEDGLHRTETETSKPAYKYQENAYRDSMLNQGYQCLEEAIKFLDTNESSFPTWADSPEHEERIRTLFINYASEFQRSYSKNLSFYTYTILRPIIQDVEIFAILPELGQAFFDELKTAILNKTTTDQQKAVIKLIQKAVAHFSIKDGIRQSLVKLDGNRIIQSERLEPQSYEKQSIPSLSSTDIKIRYQDEVGNRYISYLKKYLDDNIDDFPTYKTYLDSLTTEDENTDDDDDRPECCNCSNNCDCNSKTKTKNQAVFRL